MSVVIKELRSLGVSFGLKDVEGFYWWIVDEIHNYSPEEFSFLFETPEGIVLEIFFKEVGGELLITDRDYVVFLELDPDKIEIKKRS